ncbi:MAG: hypothetical protein Ct9H300mP11_15150 [Chloroflexota bacterium]|nr:MAG: hypothetical protein Ct9H300mP11_15150 [Chloroflexota bacterium]
MRGAVCGNGERDRAVAWEAVAEFKRQVDLRKSGEVDVYDGEVVPVSGSNGWVVIDGRGKSCAGVIAPLNPAGGPDKESFVEAILAEHSTSTM